MITIMTPTYNRATLLERLYESLLKQKKHDFEWVVVDDGSTDNTKSLIEKFASQSEIKIRYFYQENAGKAVAFNNGVKNSRGELFFCVDSDDFLTDDALEMVESCADYIKRDSIAGILALKQDINGELLGDNFPDGLKHVSIFDLSEKYGCLGEWSLIFKTDILKETLFPNIPDEKFITECVLYDKISKKYDMFLLKEVVTICEYQSAGLTNDIVQCMLKNPTGYKVFYMQRIDMAYTIRGRLRYIIRYNAFKKMSKDISYSYSGKHKVLVKLLDFMGIIGKKYYYMKAKYKI